jgi:hypothetical protein|mmetsp:Transcript_74515/g.125608  ORF Transcript_74515/g.125608 Transcript_74515/m.125608 type:complete len:93 (+) Transcript_74515:771-1049(+)
MKWHPAAVLRIPYQNQNKKIVNECGPPQADASRQAEQPPSPQKTGLNYPISHVHNPAQVKLQIATNYEEVYSFNSQPNSIQIADKPKTSGMV